MMIDWSLFTEMKPGKRVGKTKLFLSLTDSRWRLTKDLRDKLNCTNVRLHVRKDGKQVVLVPVSVNDEYDSFAIGTNNEFSGSEAVSLLDNLGITLPARYYMTLNKEEGIWVGTLREESQEGPRGGAATPKAPRKDNLASMLPGRSR